MRRGVGSILASAALVLSAACALGPNYRRPELKVPAAFRFEATPANDSFADAGWWQVYDDPTLQALIRAALVSNFDVRVAAARIDQARAMLGTTRMQQLPQISVSAEAQRAPPS